MCPNNSSATLLAKIVDNLLRSWSVFLACARLNGAGGDSRQPLPAAFHLHFGRRSSLRAKLCDDFIGLHSLPTRRASRGQRSSLFHPLRERLRGRFPLSHCDSGEPNDRLAVVGEHDFLALARKVEQGL